MNNPTINNPFSNTFQYIKFEIQQNNGCKNSD